MDPVPVHWTCPQEQRERAGRTDHQNTGRGDLPGGRDAAGRLWSPP